MTHVLLVEDDDVLREATEMGLTRMGYRVDSVGDGLDAVEFVRGTPVDLVLLDVMLPSLNGASVTRRVREFSDVPIIMVSARGDDVDTVNGLDAGADDYVVKPVNLQVLEARIRALLRRGELAGAAGADSPQPRASGAGADDAGATTGVAPVSAASGASLEESVPEAAALLSPTEPAGDTEAPPAETAIGPGLDVDPVRMRVHLDGEPVHLTPTEWKLLLLLRRAAGAVVTREELLTRVWGSAWATEARVVDVHVQRLRAKIGAGHVDTVRGFGYRFHE